MNRQLFLVAVCLAVTCLINLKNLLNTVRPELIHDKLEQVYSQKIILTQKKMMSSQSPERKELGTDPESLFQLYQNVKDQLAAQESIISFLSQPVINNHSFTYIHNPTKTCGSDKINVLFVIPSAVNNFENRERVRNGTRGDYVESSKGQAKLLFFLGKPSWKYIHKVQRRIDDESLKYGDIVQEVFDDIYKNIRLKAVSMLKWAIMFCGNAKYVIRTDDDVKVDPEKLVTALMKKGHKKNNFILGRIKKNWRAYRDKRSKYFLPKDEYPKSTLPPFILGGLLGMPMSSVKLLYQAALRVKPVWLDDVFITGICSVKVNVTLEQDIDFLFKHRSW